MSYNDLSTVKKINGIPVDLSYFQKVTENDTFLKTLIDSDEDLTALDRSITPTTDVIYNLGSNTKRFAAAWIELLNGTRLTVGAGSALLPSLSIGTAGLASLADNELSIILNNLEPVKVTTAGALIKGANDAVLKLQNTFPGSEGVWSLGSDDQGFSLVDINNAALRLRISSFAVYAYSKLLVPTGSIAFPAFSFISDPTTGMSKDTETAVLNFSTSGVSRLSLASDGTHVLNGQLFVGAGSPGFPAITFSGQTSKGLTADEDGLNYILDNKIYYKMTPEGTVFTSDIDGSNSRTVYSDTFCPTDVANKSFGTEAYPLPVPFNKDLYTLTVQGQTDIGLKQVAEFRVASQEDYINGTYGAMFGFSTTSVGETEVTPKLTIGAGDQSGVYIDESLGFSKIVHSTTGSGQQINVAKISKIIIDSTSGNIEIKGFTGGKEGQIIYIYKKVPANSFTLVFNSGTATQKLLLKGSVNYVNTNDYGGMTLSFDDGVWREVSRS